MVCYCNCAECDEKEEWATSKTCELTCENGFLVNGTCPTPEQMKYEECKCKSDFYRNPMNECVPWTECQNCYINGQVGSIWFKRKLMCSFSLLDKHVTFIYYTFDE